VNSLVVVLLVAVVSVLDGSQDGHQTVNDFLINSDSVARTCCVLLLHSIACLDQGHHPIHHLVAKTKTAVVLDETAESYFLGDGEPLSAAAGDSFADVSSPETCFLGACQYWHWTNIADFLADDVSDFRRTTRRPRCCYPTAMPVDWNGSFTS
jgi:hypothetical protein